MSRAPRWRVRGAKPKEEQKEGWVLVGRGHPASNRRGATLWIPPACRNVWIRRGAGFYFRAGREVKVRRPPGKEEGKKVLSSISTSFPRRWKSRPAQRITGDLRPPFVSPTKKSSLTISHSFPAEPPLFAIRSTTSAFPFYNIPRRPPFQSLRKNQYQSNQRLTSSVIFPAPGEFTRPIPQSPALLK